MRIQQPIIRNILRKINVFLIQFTMYNDSQDHDQERIRQGRVATRLYLVLMIIATFILVLYTTQSTQTISVNVQNPTQEQYEKMQEYHSSTLKCPCTTISIPYKNFLQIVPTYHQLCSSTLVSSDFYNSLGSSISLLGGIDFFAIAPSYFRALSFFCDMANQTFTSANNRFLSTSFVNNELISRDIFNTQMNATIQTFLETTRNQFVENIVLISSIVQIDQYFSGLGINSELRFTYSNDTPTSKTYPAYMIFSQLNSGGQYACNCRNSMYCRVLKSESGVQVSLTSFLIRCTLMDTILNSILACWYDSNCTAAVNEVLQFVRIQDGLNLTVLNSTQPSRFLPNMTVEIIFNEMMIESFYSSMTYDLFYQECHPSSCMYTYHERSSLIYIITTVVGLFGGINIILRLISPWIAMVFLIGLRFIRKKMLSVDEHLQEHRHRKLPISIGVTSTFANKVHPMP